MKPYIVKFVVEKTVYAANEACAIDVAAIKIADEYIPYIAESVTCTEASDEEFSSSGLE